LYFFIEHASIQDGNNPHNLNGNSNRCTIVSSDANIQIGKLGGFVILIWNSNGSKDQTILICADPCAFVGYMTTSSKLFMEPRAHFVFPFVWYQFDLNFRGYRGNVVKITFKKRDLLCFTVDGGNDGSNLLNIGNEENKGVCNSNNKEINNNKINDTRKDIQNATNNTENETGRVRSYFLDKDCVAFVAFFDVTILCEEIYFGKGHDFDHVINILNIQGQ